ncbi:tRNA adenosine(34) deaminase TadA [Glaciecola sp. MH2013]|nr:tRNA adenosine(34) deaminase TadA [Glaciecola sp. MH2013]
MHRALALAEKAEAIGEVPVGAVVVIDGTIIGEGYNQPITLHDPSAHAELIALKEAAKNIQNYRVTDATVYVTLEPCPMCAGAMLHGRVKRIVFGAFDEKTGALGSVMDLVNHDYANHQIEVDGGCLKNECASQISAFFKKRRQQKKTEKRIKQQSKVAGSSDKIVS